MTTPRDDGRYEAPLRPLPGVASSVRRARIAMVAIAAVLGTALGLAIVSREPASLGPAAASPSNRDRGGPRVTVAPRARFRPTRATARPTATRSEHLLDVPNVALAGAPGAHAHRTKRPRPDDRGLDAGGRADRPRDGPGCDRRSEAGVVFAILAPDGRRIVVLTAASPGPMAALSPAAVPVRFGALGSRRPVGRLRSPLVRGPQDGRHGRQHATLACRHGRRGGPCDRPDRPAPGRGLPAVDRRCRHARPNDGRAADGAPWVLRRRPLDLRRRRLAPAGHARRRVPRGDRTDRVEPVADLRVGKPDGLVPNRARSAAGSSTRGAAGSPTGGSTATRRAGRRPSTSAGPSRVPLRHRGPTPSARTGATTAACTS